MERHAKLNFEQNFRTSDSLSIIHTKPKTYTLAYWVKDESSLKDGVNDLFVYQACGSNKVIKK